jgi:ATP-dependent Lon protease
MRIFKKSVEEFLTGTIEELRQMIAPAEMPSHVQQIANKELEMLSKISAEYTIGLAYIDYLISLPWNKKTEDKLDLDRVEKVVNEGLYGLRDTIKKRVLEYLDVKTLKKPRILVVDDENIALRNLERVLIKEGCAVVTANSGVEAVEKLETSAFDVVMTDLKMEKITGMDVLKKTKSKYPDAQVIMITGYASVDTAVEAIRKGAVNYIEKPIKFDEVRSTVKQALGKKLTTRTIKESVLCFAGPSGTGKTALGKVIAEALGRRFARISLGGMKDEAEIRGRRRTYAGAMPGRIIEEIRRIGFANPVLMLDEVDKIGQEFEGDPVSVLLEVLDPKQNHSFIDYYLDVPFNLSSVMFIVTANIIENVQEPLRDRMEVIEFSGYTEDEKKEIALKYLVPRQIYEKGLSDYPPEFSAEAISKIIQEHTREVGIRNLERQIAIICRKIADEYVHYDEMFQKIKLGPEMVRKYLGPRKY